MTPDQPADDGFGRTLLQLFFVGGAGLLALFVVKLAFDQYMSRTAAIAIILSVVALTLIHKILVAGSAFKGLKWFYVLIQLGSIAACALGVWASNYNLDVCNASGDQPDRRMRACNHFIDHQRAPAADIMAARGQRALLYGRKKELYTAFEEANAYIKFAPSNGRAWLVRCELQMSDQRYDLAIQDCSWGLTLDPAPDLQAALLGLRRLAYAGAQQDDLAAPDLAASGSPPDRHR